MTVTAADVTHALDRFPPNARLSTIRQKLLVEIKADELRECAAVEVRERDICRIVRWEVERETGGLH